MLQTPSLIKPSLSRSIQVKPFKGLLAQLDLMHQSLLQTLSEPSQVLPQLAKYLHIRIARRLPGLMIVEGRLRP